MIFMLTQNGNSSEATKIITVGMWCKYKILYNTNVGNRSLFHSEVLYIVL